MLKRYRHAQLLVTLALLLVVRPFLDGLIGLALVDVFLMLALVSAVVACATSRRHLVVGVTLAVLVQASALYRAYYEIEAVSFARLLLLIALFGYVTALVLADVFRRGASVDRDTIFGALAAYFLLGLTWAFAFALLESLAPGSFTGPGLAEKSGASTQYDYQRFIGYSFVTLTTLGYGNVVPATARADALAISEAVMGQIYLTVLVARLVALNLMGGGSGSSSGGSSSATQKTT
jgi:hypothetical protein